MHIQIDLGLPDDDRFTPIKENATPYEVWKQKVEDLGEAREEIQVLKPVPIKGEVEIFVSVNGNDENTGTKEEPFRTIQRALTHVESLRAQRKEQLIGDDISDIVIYLRKGKYNIAESIIINEKHAGSAEDSLCISAYENEAVIISGGIDMDANIFKPAIEVAEENVYCRINKNVRSRIVAVDIEKCCGDLNVRKAEIDEKGPKYQIYVNGELFQPARYPKERKLTLSGRVLDMGEITASYSSIGPIGTNSESTGVEYEMTDFRPITWYNDGNIWLKGSLYAEWDIRNIRVAEIREKSIKLDKGCVLGAVSSPENTYFYYNILEELQTPGEYYLEKNKGILFLCPTDDMADAVVTYSCMQEPLMCMNNTKNFVLNGLIFEYCAACGVIMNECFQTIIQNCIIRNVDVGIMIDGKKSGIIHSQICHTVNKPIEFLKKQEIFNYIPERNFVQNCYIHHTGMQNGKLSCMTVRGTGNVVSHNFIENTYASSIYLQNAKECIVEYNEIVGGPVGIYDMASIYQPYQPSDTGNHVRYNYIHDIAIFSDTYHPSAIYFDEGLSGNFAYGNIMKNVPCGFFTNSGSENVIIGNTVMNGRKKMKFGIRCGIRGEDNFVRYSIAERFARSEDLKNTYCKYMELSSEEKNIIKKRYPLMAGMFDRLRKKIMEEGEDGGIGFFEAHDNYIADNQLYDCGGIFFFGSGHVYHDNRIAQGRAGLCIEK